MRGVTQPIVGAAQPYTEKRLADFLAASGTVLLPMRPLTGNLYTVNSHILCQQIHQLAKISGRTNSPLFDIEIPYDSSPSFIPPHGFSELGNVVYFCGCRFAEEPSKLLSVLMRDPENPVSTKALIQELGGTEEQIEGRFEKIRHTVASILKGLGHPSSTTIIETMGHRGRRFNQEGLAHVKELCINAEESFSECGFSL